MGEYRCFDDMDGSLSMNSHLLNHPCFHVSDVFIYATAPSPDIRKHIIQLIQSSSRSSRPPMTASPAFAPCNLSHLSLKPIRPLQLRHQVNILLLRILRTRLGIDHLLPGIVLVLFLHPNTSYQHERSSSVQIFRQERSNICIKVDVARTWKAKLPGCTALVKSSPVPVL